MFLVFITMLSACAAADTTALSESPEIKTYREQIQQCDETAKYDLEFGDLTTTGMANSVDKQIDCYEDIAHKIIDKHYTQTATEMKQHLKEFINSAYTVSGDMNTPDECYPQCGTVIINLSRNDTAHIIEKYLLTLVDALDWRLFQ